MIWPAFVVHPIIILRFENVLSDCLSGTCHQIKMAGYHKHKSVTAVFMPTFSVFVVAVKTMTIL